jgi:non-specific serine/threonine protein kinase
MELSADLATVAGNLDLAVRRALEGEALSREIGDPLRLNMVLSVRARILFHLGDFETAITILEEALALGPYPACTASDLCNLGVATRMAGDPRKAIELLEAGFAFANKIDLTYVASTVIMCLADALRDLGQTERSETLYRDGLARAIEQQEWRNAAIAICGLAVLAANAGDCARAARLCGAADVLLERVGAAMTPGGQECYGEATRLARVSLGDDAFERERLAGRLLSPQMVLVDAPGTSPARRGGLTRRELQVLRLLADGRDTREIADALYISPRTVDNHVASMLSKLGVRSRAAAVGVALRNELI